jgi:hypothetical protein
LFKDAQLLLTSQKILQLHVCIYEDIRPVHYIVQIPPRWGTCSILSWKAHLDEWKWFIWDCKVATLILDLQCGVIILSQVWKDPFK